jgi:hypothetical protein
MRTRGLLVRAVVIVVLARAAVARAGDDPQKAKQLFQEGTTYFDLGQFDKAIDSWQQGYKAKPDPGFLYNIGQAYRLAGDPQKAIFFYKGYLRNSPKAPNRADVEQRIAALQKQITEGGGKSPPPITNPPPAHTDTASPPGGNTPPAIATAPPTPPATEPPPVTPPPVVPPPPAETVVGAALPPQPSGQRPVDLAGAIGTDLWASGVRGKAQPSFAFTLTGGYTFGGPADRTMSFRLGGFFGYTFLDEAASKETFIALLVVPSLRMRVAPERVYLRADLGLGVLALGGLKPTSALLAPMQAVMINGAQSMLEVRPALALEILLKPSLGVFAETAIAASPKKQYFYQPINRVELLAGLTYRL